MFVVGLTDVIVTFSCSDGLLKVGPITISSPTCQSLIDEVTEILLNPARTVAFALVQIVLGALP